MSLNDDGPNTADLLGETPNSRVENNPTFPSEAEALLGNLKLGAARAGPRPAPADELPRVPNYEIECELGSGGMGVVYRARHAVLRQAVAVKMIRPSVTASPAEVARFLAEAESIASVKHPNVVQVYDLGDAGGRPYFVMEYVAGGNLANRLKAGRLAPRAAAELLEPVARGVQAAHDAGIVHRDLKPANILLAGDRKQETGNSKQEAESGKTSAASSLSPVSCPLSPLTPKVSDFGLAKRLSSDMTRSQAVMGTPQYMAPEQAGGKAKFVGPAADVYALGVILYECLTGAVPFKGDDAWSLIRQVLEETPVAPRRRVPGVPRDLELICLKCLEKEPHHRYPTAAALADDLKRFLENKPVSVRPIDPVTRVARWARRRPTAAGLVALAVLLALIVPPALVWVKWSLDQSETDAVQAQEREEAARKLALALRQKADEAKRAEDEANRAKVTAEQLADARELFAIENKLRSRAAARPLGWTAANRADLPKAITLARGDTQVLRDLRSAAADALLAPDLFALEPVVKVMTGCALATDPNTGLVAVGEFKGWGACRIQLFDPATGQVKYRFSYKTPLIAEVQDGTRALAFSPNGKYLFAGTRYSKLMRFDLDTPGEAPAKAWKASSGSLDQLAVSADGKTVYGRCSTEAPVFAWDTDTGKPQKTFTPDNGAVFRWFALLPSSELVAVTGGQLYRYRADGTRANVLANVSGQRIAVNGSQLLVGDGRRLAVHDLNTGEATDLFTDPALRLSAHDEYVKSIAVHPSGAFVATAAGDTTRAVKVWELASGRLVGIVRAPGTDPIVLVWSADGTYLLATAAGHVARWKFAPTAVQRFACVGGFPLEAAALVPNDRVAALGEVWNGRRELLVGVPGARADAVALADTGGNGRAGLTSAPDGTLAATVSAPGVFHWRPGAPVSPPRFTKTITWCPRFTPDGRGLWAVADSKEVQSFDPATANQRAKWRNSIGEVVSGLAALDALAVGRTRAVAGGPDGTVFVLDPGTCEPTATFKPDRDPVLSVALAPDDALVVAGTQKGKVRVIRPADRTELPAISAHAGPVTAVSVSRDGTLLATGGRDRTVQLWKRTGDSFEPLLAVSDLPGVVRDVQFGTADDRLLVLLGHEHAVRVWDVTKLKAQLAELKLGW